MMMLGWSIAAVLYALPILAGIRDWDGLVDEANDWMRSDEGEWFPSLAPYVAAVGLILWPLGTALDAITPRPRE